MTGPNQQQAPTDRHRFQRGGRIYDQMCGLCNAVADAPIHQMGDIERAAVATAPAAPEERAVARQNNFKIAKSIVRDWLMEKGVALTGVNGEVSYSTIQRFKLDLASRIVDALQSAAKER